jgi:spermidine/putrescine-binding protein
MINRRTALGGAAAFAAGAALPAHAQDNKRIIVGTWGGDYSRLLAKNIETPLLAPEGWDIVKDEAQAPPRRAKMMAEKALRRGTSDIQGLSANDMYEVNEQGLAEQLDYSKMPNAANLIPAMKYQDRQAGRERARDDRAEDRRPQGRQAQGGGTGQPRADGRGDDRPDRQARERRADAGGVRQAGRVHQTR